MILDGVLEIIQNFTSRKCNRTNTAKSYTVPKFPTVFIYLFIIILHAPLLCSNTTCIGGFLHNYTISTKIPCSIYKFVKLSIIFYNL